MSATQDLPSSARGLHHSSTASTGSYSSLEAPPTAHVPIGPYSESNYQTTDDVNTGSATQKNGTVGTELFTITEKSSVTTMKTLPVDGTFQRRIISARPQTGRDTRLPSGDINSLRRRDRFSLDEDALQKLHLASDV